MAFSDETNVFREKFNKKVSELLEKKRQDNNAVLTRERYEKLVAKVKDIKVKQRKESGDYRRMARYDVLVVGDREMLIKPIKEQNSVVNYYIASDELFDILHGTHISIGHAGRNKMVQELKTTYCNITQEVIMIYLSLCKQCTQKKGSQKKIVTNSTVTVNINSCGQVDLVDMEPKLCGEYRFIMVYQDQLTKFVMLKALHTNGVEEISNHLLDIFTTIGVPATLQSHNGREFSSKVIKALRSLWKDIRLVHGNAQGPSQTEHFKTMLLQWMNDNKTKKWVTGLKFLQFTRNRTYHEDIEKSPFEAMFGCKANVGLTSLSLPEKQLKQLETEEDLERLMNSHNEAGSSTVIEEIMIKQENCIVCGESVISTYSCDECGGIVHETCTGIIENQKDCAYKVICALCTRPSKKVRKESDDDTFL